MLNDRIELRNGCEFQSSIGIAEISASFMILVIGLFEVFGFVPVLFSRSELLRMSFFGSMLVYIVLFVFSIWPRLKDKNLVYRYPRGEFAITIMYSAIVVTGLVFWAVQIKESLAPIDPMYVWLSFVLLTCIYLMLQGFVSKVSRMIVYSQFCLLIVIIWLAQIMSFRELFYVIVPFGVVLLIIGAVNYICFITHNPKLD